MSLKKKKKGTPKQEADFLAQEAKEEAAQAPEYTLDIPDEDIWSYQIEGLQAPKVGADYSKAKGPKILVVVILLIAISASIFLSVRAVHNDEYQFKELEDGTYELVRYTNPGDAKDIVIDYYVDDDGKKDTSKPITVINEYAFNCDEVVDTITFGKDVKKIDGKSIYSCWWITNVHVDKENQSYCDLDGVLYTKDMKEIVFYPNDHDKYLRQKLGYDKLVDDDGNPMEELWGPTKKYDEAFYEEYNRKIRTYVVPSTVETVGQLAFAYSNLTDLYLPEGLKRIESMGIFKVSVLNNIYSYTTGTAINDTTYQAVSSFKTQYNSLPEGLVYIGSDALYYERGLSYLYLPSSVTYIGHHAFWDAVYKEDGTLKGITEINTALSEEDFKKQVETGDQWRPRYDYKLFKKSVDVHYGVQRQ